MAKESMLRRSGGSEFQSLGAELLNAIVTRQAVTMAFSEMTRRRGSEGTDGCSNVKEVQKIWRGEVVDTFESKKEYFIADAI